MKPNNFFFIVFLLFSQFIPNDGRDGLRNSYKENTDRKQAGSGEYPLRQPADTTYIYLTIDDGPSSASDYLSGLARTDSVPITVFLIGNRIFQRSDWRDCFDLYQQNHFIEIGNHSFSHAGNRYRQYYSNAEQVVKDFHLNEDTLNLQAKSVRLPGRNTWRIDGKKRTDLKDDSAAANKLAGEGYRIFGWDLEWHCAADSSGSILSADSLLQQIESIVRSRRLFKPHNLVLLCHESMFESDKGRTQLELLLQLIKQKQSYRFRFLKNYPGL